MTKRTVCGAPTGAPHLLPDRVVVGAADVTASRRGVSVRRMELATFKLDDPDVLVRAALACPYCLSSDQRFVLREAPDEFSLRCSCRSCGHQRRVEITDEQALRLAIAPPL